MKRNILFIITLLIFVVSGCGSTDSGDDNLVQDQEKVEINEEDENNADIPEEVEKVEEVIEKDSKEAEVVIPQTQLEVHYIDVGQADATLLQFESYTILIDAGDWDSTDVVTYLQGLDITEIDIAIGTHPDADHIGQLDKVIQNFEVGEVWLSGNTSTSETFQRLMDEIEVSGVDYDEPRAGDIYDVGSLQIEILYPYKISGNANQESISMKLTYGEVTFVFTGDAEVDQETEMINGSDVDATILQLGHHGSDTSTSEAFLQAVSPEVVIYSAGNGNAYGHPHYTVVNRVENYGAKLYGTDVHGTIVVTTDGKDYSIVTKQEGKITPSDEKKEQKQEATNDKDSEQSSTACVNINTAPIDELESIIHIGPERAKDLVKQRPYQSVDNLTKINGIGPARIADIKTEGIACIGG
ncbi:MBL fold metallo-hydrolase [Aquibacillus koreensis]|uniref:MBL fold metallo-hydrolase n=1 Tax=Aquibacillus koreensis TaxID=279446 RepID=A0A9X3WLI9_9BACI|nr:MBL fold metallo-hydrolase [Aquibacillus koreensis]MCT2537708.1 MBL fold metallo-hydrolase [Aquibacillus koreensis]MDC3420945.1 MBL fold metallo-hydrolase [Aquibacillus koreensis]